MAYSQISLLSCFLACLLISNGVSARLLENLFAKINQDGQDHTVTRYRREASDESSLAQAPASAPTLQPSQLSLDKQEHALAPAPAPENQFPSSAAAGQYTAINVKPSTVDEESEAKLDDDDNDHDDDDHDHDDDDDHDHDDDDDHDDDHDHDHDDGDDSAMAPSPK